MGKEWPKTAEQKAWVKIMVDQYIALERDGKDTSIHISTTIEHWLKCWPESERLFGPSPDTSSLTEEERAQRKVLVAEAVEDRRKVHRFSFFRMIDGSKPRFCPQKISGYLRREARKAKPGTTRQSKSKKDPIAALLKPQKKQRKAQHAHVLAKLRQNDVEAKLRDQLSPLAAGATTVEKKAYHAQWLKTRNGIIYDMWHNADDETRKLVEQEKMRLDEDAGLVESEEGEGNGDDDDNDEDLWEDVPKRAPQDRPKVEKPRRDPSPSRSEKQK